MIRPLPVYTLRTARGDRLRVEAALRPGTAEALLLTGDGPAVRLTAADVDWLMHSLQRVRTRMAEEGVRRR
jgi:hypothetical protein